MAVQNIDSRHLGLCASALLLVVLASRLLELGLERRIVVAALRCAVQLTVLCAFVLEPMFTRNSPWMILAYLGLIIVLASREASARLKYVYPGIRKDFCFAFAAGGGAVVVFAVGAVLQLDPWWDAMYAVPVSGMIIGNVLTATGLGTDVYLTELSEGADRIDLYLCRGASWREACLPAVRASLTAALTPTLNSMGVMGLVMMPGMMTGQMLGGQAPVQAGLYQVMIMYLITVSGCLTPTLTIALASNAAFDRKEHALLRGKLGKREAAASKDVLLDFFAFLGSLCSPSSLCSKVSWFKRGKKDYKPVEAPAPGYGGSDAIPQKPPTLVQDAASLERDPASVALQAKGLVCAVTGLEASLRLVRGTRTSLTGPTGVGKSQLLKTLARLVPAAKGALLLDGEQWEAPAWRARVCYVNQDRPTLAGTPNELFRGALKYRAQRTRCTASGDRQLAPAQVASAWGLDASKFDEMWATLSGGEAQRAALAVALALEPLVLLLDEPTSACDEDTALKIERSLIESGITILLTTHSKDQAARLCDSHLVASPAAGDSC
ncbi:hypothetical protein M885DRAFT_456134 [Pelagophyceae sp. CCMP2097]|nr:hypothetical protein M885DRAFT_456134 [Pelagophyceae sp. CCMP2097]|mmetsp:Transcript_25480/g.85591  ORF Transcript_25480/g.85591 Transcript_25480/m.85591 type:complete len:551 (+) Transcript_25480:55-1707(+)